MTISYLPVKFLRRMAGGSKHEGNYVLPRAHCEPPQSLRRLVFPWIEEWTARVQARAAGKKWKAGGLQQDDGAADCFLKLMLLLRDVLLQDLAVLYPSK
jgi:hypothetical protein